MNDLITWLEGKKTYIAAVLGAALNIAIIFGWLGELSAEQIIAIEGLIAAVLGSTLRAGISKQGE